jgi:tetratricopeptide (TPR) repeat protein
MPLISLRAYHREIELLIEQSSFSQAVAHCLSILKIYPKSINTYRILGKAFLDAKKYKEAAEVFERVLSVYPDDFVSHVALSITKEDERDVDSAIHHMEIAFDTQPSNLAVQEELKRLFGRRDGAEPQKIGLSRGALIRMYAKGELFQQAITEIETTLASDPQRIDLKIILARMQFLMGSLVQSAEVCNQILTQLPYCFEPNQLLYAIYTKNGILDSAKIFLDRLVQLDPYFAYISTPLSSSEEVSEENVQIKKLLPDDQELDVLATPALLPTFFDPDQAEPFTWLPEKAQNVQLEVENIANANQQTNNNEDPSLESVEENEAPSSQRSNSDDASLPGFLTADGWTSPIDNQGAIDENLFSSIGEETPGAEEGEIPAWLRNLAPVSEENLSEMEKEYEVSNFENPLDNDISVNNGKIIDPLQEEKEINMTNNDENIPTPKNDSSDWMSQFIEDSKKDQQSSENGKDLPDWLKNFESEEEVVDETSSELPDWLKSLDSDNNKGQIDSTVFEETSIPVSALFDESDSSPTETIETDPLVGTNNNPAIKNEIDESGQAGFISQIHNDEKSLFEAPAFATPNNTEISSEVIGDQDAIPFNSTEPIIPDWVKSVLSSESEESDSINSTLIDSENVSSDETSASIESVSKDEFAPDVEGVISQATNDELLEWLRKISPETDESQIIEPLDLEIPPGASIETEPFESALDRLDDITAPNTPPAINSPQFNDANENSPMIVDTPDIVSQTTTESSEDLLQFSTPPLQDTTLSSNKDVVENTVQTAEIEDASLVNELNQLVESNEFSSALNLLNSKEFSDTEQLLVLDSAMRHSPENEANFEYYQFLGDLNAHFNRFEEAFSNYVKAENILTAK